VNFSQISSQTLLGKLIRFPFKLLPSGAVVRILRGPARGQRWISDSSTRGFWLGYWELENQRLFAHHLHPGEVVYDIGAHVGLYTILSSIRVQSAGHVYAFEPLPRNLHFLRRHAELNHLSNCTIVEAAVSDSSGMRTFDPTEHDSAGHFSSSGSLSVRAVSLDEFVVSAPGIRPPTAMKVNAEGAEMEVLSGGRRVISTYFPLIFLSTHSPQIHQKCANFLKSTGYAVREISSDKLWAVKQR
jgi:FkbM family methyltransferase